MDPKGHGLGQIAKAFQVARSDKHAYWAIIAMWPEQHQWPIGTWWRKVR